MRDRSLRRAIKDALSPFWPCLAITIVWLPLGAPSAITLALMVAGCTALPAAAPTITEVEHPFDPGYPFVLVNLNDTVVSALSQVRQDGFIGKFQSKAPPANLRIAVGDTLQIGIIEAGGGLFGGQQPPSAAGGVPTLGSQGVNAQATLLLPVTVERDGDIRVPFAGSVHAAGLTPDQLGAEIERLLAKKALNPQVEVYVTLNPTFTANSATVAGEVYHAAMFPLLPSGNKLLDLIAEAGSARYPAYELNVHLTRGNRTFTASLQNIVDDPRENIYIYPRDTIYLSRDPRTFTVLGATSHVGRYPFDTKRVTLAEAVAEGGGFTDTVADPAGVFLFRFEPPDFVASIRPDLAGMLNGPVPVIYKVDLRGGDGYFLAQSFELRDKDVILLANAAGTQWLKFLAIARGLTGIYSDFHSGIPGAATSSAF